MPLDDLGDLKDAPSKSTAPSFTGKARKFAMVVPVVAVAVVGIWFWASRGATPATAPAPESQTQVRSTLHLETFVLNLADPDQRAYLRVGIDLGLGREEKRDEAALTAPVRDTILGVLAQAKADELMTAEGKTKLKESLLKALQERIPELGVQEVYFTEFLIQR
jgi:flagellar basal body-associated protein FliL